MASTHPIPTARQGPAQRNRFPINKTAYSRQEDFMGRKISQNTERNPNRSSRFALHPPQTNIS